MCGRCARGGQPLPGPGTLPPGSSQGGCRSSCLHLRLRARPELLGEASAAPRPPLPSAYAQPRVGPLTCPGSGRTPSSPNTRTPSRARTGPPRARASGSAPATAETGSGRLDTAAPGGLGRRLGGPSLPPSSPLALQVGPCRPPGTSRWAGGCGWCAHSCLLSRLTRTAGGASLQEAG